jgi:hypothetical protein
MTTDISGGNTYSTYLKLPLYVELENKKIWGLQGKGGLITEARTGNIYCIKCRRR